MQMGGLWGERKEDLWGTREISIKFMSLKPLLKTSFIQSKNDAKHFKLHQNFLYLCFLDDYFIISISQSFCNITLNFKDNVPCSI